MAFKFPGTSIGLGAVGDMIKGRSVGSTVTGAGSKSADILVSAGTGAINRKLDSKIQQLESKIGVGLGRTSIGKILDDPFGALGDILPSNVGGIDGRGGWLPRLQNRADPLMEIDWVPILPLGLEPEYVEEIQWSHARFNASTGIYQHGARVYMIEGMEHAPITLTFYEDRMLTVTSWLYKWRSLQFDEYNRTFGWPSDYKLDIVALMKDVKNNTVGRVLFVGCFPTNFPQLNMQSDSSTRVRLQAEFSCDRVMFESFGVPGDGGGGTASWMSVLSNGAGTVASAAFGSLTGSLKPAIDTANAYIGSAKSAVKNVFDSLAGKIRF